MNKYLNLYGDFFMVNTVKQCFGPVFFGKVKIMGIICVFFVFYVKFLGTENFYGQKNSVEQLGFDSNNLSTGQKKKFT